MGARLTVRRLNGTAKDKSDISLAAVNVHYTEGTHNTKLSLPCTRSYGFFENDYLLSGIELIRLPYPKTFCSITMAFRAFVRSPSRASQFRRTAFDTEPASPIQKYSRRRCADSIGVARVAGKHLLHFFADSLDGLTTPDGRKKKGRCRYAHRCKLCRPTVVLKSRF